jgi:hypothetical protein
MSRILVGFMALGWILWVYQAPQGLVSDPKAWTKLMVFNEATPMQTSCETLLQAFHSDPARRRVMCVPESVRPWERP